MRCDRLGWLAIGWSLLLLAGGVSAGAPASGYHLLKKIPLGAAPGGGEYFDYITVDATGVSLAWHRGQSCQRG